MAVTKTNFINYLRCPRYVALAEVHKAQLDADVSLAQYLEEEKADVLNGLVGMMYDAETEEDLIDVPNEQLEIMMPYYKRVEELAGRYVAGKLEGTPQYSDKTYNQMMFEVNINGIRYLCYVDIYNERKDSFDIIEVKATTSKKFVELGSKVNKEFISLFTKDENGIYRLLDEMDYSFDEYKYEKYLSQKAHLYDRLHDCGHYVYDLAVQRYIIEKELKEEIPPDVKYYLAVLNHEYVYDGKSAHETDEDGNDIISLIDLTKVTGEMMDKIELDRKRVEEYLFRAELSPCKIGSHCEHKKTTKCKFCPVCFKDIPPTNSIFSYIDGHHGFKDELDNKYERWDLVNDGVVSILDVPANYLNRAKNQIQRAVVENETEYIDCEKIKVGLKNIKYPIYHLDFESFPCPLPRHRGEKPYSQSLFQFSLHVESVANVCDKEQDHYEYLMLNLDDNREELVKKMCEYIKDDGGTVLVYNESFEKTRLKELAELFPEYRSKLLNIRSRIFDLLFLIKSNTKFYEELGFGKQFAGMFNYYHKDLSGSFSIKKVLPIFSDLTYKGMEVGNGMEALVTYATFPNLDEATYHKKYQALIKYCQQDTWAMVEILKKLRYMCEGK